VYVVPCVVCVCGAVCSVCLWCCGKNQIHAQRKRYVWNVEHVVCHTPRVLQCVAVCCCVLQCVAVCCSVLQFVAVRN